MAEITLIRPFGCEADYCDELATHSVLSKGGDSIGDFCQRHAEAILLEVQADEDAREERERARRVARRLIGHSADGIDMSAEEWAAYQRLVG